LRPLVKVCVGAGLHIPRQRRRAVVLDRENTGLAKARTANGFHSQVARRRSTVNRIPVLRWCRRVGEFLRYAHGRGSPPPPDWIPLTSVGCDFAVVLWVKFDRNLALIETLKPRSYVNRGP
jgi:hypothetical protein